MAIVQISKIQQRAGNLVDLPQLDNGEFGWATDENRLFIGRTGNAYLNENIEVLTSYSNISFSQIDGSDGGNFNVTTPLNGQILTYVSSTDTWENYTGFKSQLGGTKLQLGNVANISMTGGAIGYVLETDGAGNLSWTPKGTLYTTIKGLTNNVTGNIITMTVSNSTPYTNGQLVTISGGTISNSGANSNINGNTFYLKLNGDYATSGNVVLYTDTGLTVTANGAGLVSYTANSGVATATLGVTGSGVVGGSNTTVQFNDQNISNGVAAFTFNKNTTTLTISSGNVIAANINATTAITSPILVSNISTGTAPLSVISTTQVANMNVATASNLINGNSNVIVTANGNVSMYITGNATAQMIITATGANIAGNANIVGNANVGNIGAARGIFSTSANIPLINSGTSNITLTSGGNVSTYIAGNATAQFVVTSTGANIAGTANIVGNANVGNLGVTGVFATTLSATSNANVGNLGFGTGLITGTGNITAGNIIGIIAAGSNTITTTGNANVGNLGFGSGLITGTGNANLGNLNVTSAVIASTLTSNVATGTAPLTITSTTVVPNLYVSRSNVAEYSNVQTTGINSTWYPVFVNANTSANYQLASNTSLSFNSSNGALYATTFIGNVFGNISGNLTVSGSNTQVLFNDAGIANATSGFTFNKSTGVVSITGNLVSGNANLGNAATANFFIGAGNNLSNIQGANVSGNVGNALNAYAVAGANVSGTVANATYATSAGSATTAGTVTTNAQPNITSVGTLTSLSVTGNVTASNFVGSGAGTPTLSSATNLDLSAPVSVRVVGGGTLRLPNLTSAAIANLIAANGDVAYNTTSNKFQAYEAGAWSNVSDLPTTVLSTGANTTVGNITGNWQLTAGSRLNATYADLAEYYEADQHYEPGTVLAFGGDKEVTIAEDNTARVAGVVSTNPAYAMNANCQGIATAIALQGRVPTKVRGTIHKGDMMVSGGNGFARPSSSPLMGTVIGKALENFDGVEGVIEIAVGRL